MDILVIISFVFSLLIFIGLIFTAIISYCEKEIKAFHKSFWTALLVGISFIYLSFNSEVFTIIFSIAFIMISLLLLIPFGRKSFPYDDTPLGQIDERDTMFSRSELTPGTKNYIDYYELYPEKEKLDNIWRQKPGLLSRDASTYNRFQYAAADASFVAVSHFRELVDKTPLDEPAEIEPARISNFIKRWARKLGAKEVRITKMQEYHYYSVAGRGDDYGEPVIQRHKYGICIAVEMDHEMMSMAPKGPTVMESAGQYMNAGVIAMQVAEFIKLLGYNARAHIDGRYQVVCPLVARDAGMGEIGRMGILMTPNVGPRVRLAVVTADIPLITDKRLLDYTMIDFCIKCKKCAGICPGNAISFDRPEVIDGVKRWQINQEKCYDFWCRIGTDCSRCVAVCPYSHPDNVLHNSVRFGIINSPLFRLAAVKMDDVLYGAKPPTKKTPPWLDI